MQIGINPKICFSPSLRGGDHGIKAKLIGHDNTKGQLASGCLQICLQSREGISAGGLNQWMVKILEMLFFRNYALG